MEDTDSNNQSNFELVVVSPDMVIFEGAVTKIIVPTSKQEIAILPDHTPLYAQLIKGTIIIHPVNDKIQSVPIEGGIIRVKVNRASIIVGFEALHQLAKN